MTSSKSGRVFNFKRSFSEPQKTDEVGDFLEKFTESADKLVAFEWAHIQKQPPVEVSVASLSSLSNSRSILQIKKEDATQVQADVTDLKKTSTDCQPKNKG